MIEKEVWIGLASVRARPGNRLISDRKGAFVNVLTMATDIEDYVRIVTEALDKDGFDVEGIEDSEPFSMRILNSSPNQELRGLADEVRSKNQVRMGPYHTYPDDDLSS